MNNKKNIRGDILSVVQAHGQRGVTAIDIKRQLDLKAIPTSSLERMRRDGTLIERDGCWYTQLAWKAKTAQRQTLKEAEDARRKTSASERETFRDRIHPVLCGIEAVAAKTHVQALFDAFWRATVRFYNDHGTGASTGWGNSAEETATMLVKSVVNDALSDFWTRNEKNKTKRKRAR